MTQHRTPGRGIVSGPVDVDARRRPPPKTELRKGLVVEHRASGVTGAVLSWAKGQVVVVDRRQAKHRFPLEPGGFMVEGRVATLTIPAAPTGASGTSFTASGSVAVPRAPARVARASRLWVEGRHDAELLEKVWGDDLRHEGVVVELLDGVDHLETQLDRFGPGPDARVGVLVDHLVSGSKESRVAAAVRRPHVMVRGHRFVDVWAAIAPGLVGLDAWPQVDRSQTWKDGICAALGVAEPWAFWQQLLGKVRTYADLDPSLVGAVEELIDFVTEPVGDGTA
ncbi:MAG: DUF3097 family protein [Acidimicrobiales bacterium]